MSVAEEEVLTNSLTKELVEAKPIATKTIGEMDVESSHSFDESADSPMDICESSSLKVEAEALISIRKDFQLYDSDTLKEIIQQNVEKNQEQKKAEDISGSVEPKSMVVEIENEINTKSRPTSEKRDKDGGGTTVPVNTGSVTADDFEFKLIRCDGDSSEGRDESGVPSDWNFLTHMAEVDRLITLSESLGSNEEDFWELASLGERVNKILSVVEDRMDCLYRARRKKLQEYAKNIFHEKYPDLQY